MKKRLSQITNRFFPPPRTAGAVLLLATLASAGRTSANSISPATTTIVVPSQDADAAAPGGGFIFNGDNARSLAIYDSSLLITEMPQGGLITQIALRLDERNRSDVTGTIPDLELRMSTSPSLKPHVPSLFSTYVGSDETVVFPRGPVSFVALAAPSGPNPFSIVIPLKKPFFYDPSRGNLALDFRAYRAAVQQDGSSFDDVLDADGSAAMLQGDIRGPEAGILGSNPVLQLQFIGVPEPCVWLIGGIGAAVLLVLSNRKGSE